jgi:hypothetical protein
MRRHNAAKGVAVPDTVNAGPFFSLLVVGDPRLPESVYPVIRDTLDCLLARRLPRVRIVYALSCSFGRLAERYATERKLLKDPVSAGPEQFAEMLQSHAHAAVVFDAGEDREARFLRRGPEQGLTVRVIDVRELIGADPAPG